MEEVLALRDNTGDKASRARDLNLADWVPDLFMQRVESRRHGACSTPRSSHAARPVWRPVRAGARRGRARRVGTENDEGARSLRPDDADLARTGNGWMTFKDRSDRAPTGPRTPEPGAHRAPVEPCTEVLEVTSDDETAVATSAPSTWGATPPGPGDGERR